MNITSFVNSNSTKINQYASDITSKYSFLSISNSAVVDYISNNDLPTSEVIHNLAYSTGICSADLSGSLEAAGTTTVVATGIHLSSRILEKMLWCRFLCRFLETSPERMGGFDNLLSGIALSIILAIVLLVFGPSFVSIFRNSIKIHQASKIIHSCNRANKECMLLYSINENNLSQQQKEAIFTAMEANKQMANTYKQYRASRIAFLATAIIASLSLFALVAGAILAICCPVASPAITAAIIGCGALGGSLLLTGGVGFIVSCIYEYRKQKEASDQLQRSILHSMISNQIINYPVEYKESLISQQVANTCLLNDS